ncbi:glycoside hydrolase family 88 protein [Massilia sp. G4R7]|uniref:Glycoside hydrolase family 88 protein n=1 Tax=Massilia phyllostachyos TaxID=2898585 RepID=A0ABS8QB83_9BURK|nr:glycoside hydrolase family 88 protein [Massilia phyllostachyos]MCD2519004.1 glycoside hydrolase family 88 protein [Massilia phyllostachyos]
MKKTIPLLLAVLFAAGALDTANASGPYRNPDNKNLKDPLEGTYPVPYKLPVVAEITAQLERVRDFVDRATPSRIVDKQTGDQVTDFTQPIAGAIVAPSPNDFGIMNYEMGVVHAGLMNMRALTGDARWTALTERHLAFFAERTPYFRAQEAQFKLGRANSFARFIKPHALDDAGSMTAAMIRARLAGIGPDLSAQIAFSGDWVHRQQVRLKDGTLARNRPQAWSVWADDMYMSIPALAELGRMTGQRRYYDDAVKNALQLSGYLFNRQAGLYTHGIHLHEQDLPQFYWGRANGWAVLALSDLLDVLPKNHPGYQKVLAQHRRALRGIAQQQSGEGLWHQMLDRHDSFLETSGSAMFVYAIAHAINQGWISPTTYGSIAQAGWGGVSSRINPHGGIEDGVVATTLAGDNVYYYNRPVSVNAMAGYGPVLLAGAEIIKLLNNPRVEITDKVKTYHYRTKAP